MSFFPRSRSLSICGGETDRNGGILLKARLSEELELQYLRFRIAEWKLLGSVEHPDYYPFRDFLFQKVRDHLYFELKVSVTRRCFPHLWANDKFAQTLSSIHMGWEAALRSNDIPPLQNYADRIFAFRERINSVEITRRIHVEEWHRYCHTKDDVVDTPSQMDDMFARVP
jgi:hypothetical protein